MCNPLSIGSRCLLSSDMQLLVYLRVYRGMAVSRLCISLAAALSLLEHVLAHFDCSHESQSGRDCPCGLPGVCALVVCARPLRACAVAFFGLGRVWWSGSKVVLVLHPSLNVPCFCMVIFFLAGLARFPPFLLLLQPTPTLRHVYTHVTSSAHRPLVNRSSALGD